MPKNFLSLKNDKFGLKTVFHIIMGMIFFSIGNHSTLLIMNLIYSVTTLKGTPLDTIISTTFRISLIFLATIIYITKILKMNLSDFRICKPRHIAIWTVCAILLPASISCFFIFLVPGSFSVINMNSDQITESIINAVMIKCLSAGITEELIFRGFIMKVLEIRWNKKIAIIAPSLLFAILHIFNIPNPNLVDVLQIIIAGTLVGVMFSYITYQSGSIWSSIIVHGIWNLVIIGKILEISSQPSSMFSYTLHSSSIVLTGGPFGIEASLPSIIGYSIVAIIAWSLMRKTNFEQNKI